MACTQINPTRRDPAAAAAAATPQVTCCFAQSVASTRWMIQDELQVQTTKCDNCIIGTMIAFQYLACICNIAAMVSGNEDIAMLANLIDLAADILWCT